MVLLWLWCLTVLAGDADAAPTPEVITWLFENVLFLDVGSWLIISPCLLAETILLETNVFVDEAFLISMAWDLEFISVLSYNLLLEEPEFT